MIAEEEFRRFAELIASLSDDEWDAADRLHRVGRAQDRAARARFGRRAGVVPAVRAPAPAGRAAQQGDRLAPLGRRHERAADPRARAPLERRGRRAARGRRPEGGQGSLAHAAADALPADPVRSADRLGAAEVPARRRLHPRRVGAPHRHLRGDRPRRCTSPPTTTAASSPTSSASGRRSTASRSSSCSKGRPAASSARASAASASRSTPSTSSAGPLRSPSRHRRPRQPAPALIRERRPSWRPTSTRSPTASTASRPSSPRSARPASRSTSS